VAKDKKKKKKKDKKNRSGGSGAGTGKVTKRLRNAAQNPLVADIVTAALVAAAAALRDSNKARRLGARAGDELEELAGRGAAQGNALWQLALDVGRKGAEALMGDDAAASKTRKSTAKSKAKAAAKSSSAKPAKRASRPKVGARK
jgi:hypothetical protein